LLYRAYNVFIEQVLQYPEYKSASAKEMRLPQCIQYLSIIAF